MALVLMLLFTPFHKREKQLSRRPNRAVAGPAVERVPFGLYDVLLAAPIGLVVIGAVIASVSSRRPMADLMLLAGIVAEVAVVAWVGQFAWRKFLPYRFTVPGVSSTTHALALVLICLADPQIGIPGAGISLLGPLLPLLLVAVSPSGMTAVVAVASLVAAAVLVGYMCGHARRPCLRGAVFTSVGIAGWMFCGLLGVALCVSASG